MSEIESPVLPLDPDEPVESDCIKEKFGISRTVLLSILIFSTLGASTIIVANLRCVPLSVTVRALLTLLGVILSTPVLYMFFHIYHFFIPPLFPNFESLEEKPINQGNESV